MYDRRFPFMMPLERAALGPVRHGMAQISSRTMTRAFYNAQTRMVSFQYGDEICGGPLMLPVGDEREMPSHEIDRAVEYIQLGKVGRATKDHWAAKQALAEKTEHEVTKAKFLDDRRPDATHHAAFLSRKRRGTKKVISTPA